MPILISASNRHGSWSIRDQIRVEKYRIKYRLVGEIRVVIDRESKCHERGCRPGVRVGNARSHANIISPWFLRWVSLRGISHVTASLLWWLGSELDIELSCLTEMYVSGFRTSVKLVQNKTNVHMYVISIVCRYIIHIHTSILLF